MTSKYTRQSKAADCIKKILSLWGKAPPSLSSSSSSSSLSVPPQGDGIVLIDEVDLGFFLLFFLFLFLSFSLFKKLTQYIVLHPLKSETNFPIGQREPLDLSPERSCRLFISFYFLFFEN